MQQTDKTNRLTYLIYGFILFDISLLYKWTNTSICPHLTLIEKITDLIIFVVSNMSVYRMCLCKILIFDKESDTYKWIIIIFQTSRSMRY